MSFKNVPLVILLFLGLLSITSCAKGTDVNSLTAGKIESDEDTARDVNQPLAQRFDTSWYENGLPQPRFFSKHLIEKHRNEKASLSVAGEKTLSLPVSGIEAQLVTSNGVYLATCLENCRPRRGQTSLAVPADILLANTETGSITKIANTGDPAWEIEHIFPYGNNGIGWVERTVDVRPFDPLTSGDNDMSAPWRIKVCEEATNCRATVLYQESSGQTDLQCKANSVSGNHLLCWYMKKYSSTDGYPYGKYSLFHLDLSKKDTQGEVLLEDSQLDYDFIWNTRGNPVFVSQWGCDKLVCRDKDIEKRVEYPAEFRETTFKTFPEYKVIKTLKKESVPEVSFVYGSKWVTWQDYNPSPFMIGYGQVRKYLNLDEGGPIRVLGEASTLVRAWASDKYILYTDETGSVYLVNPIDNTRITLFDGNVERDTTSLYYDSPGIYGDKVYWIEGSFPSASDNLEEAIRSHSPILHEVRIVSTKKSPM